MYIIISATNEFRYYNGNCEWIDMVQSNQGKLLNLSNYERRALIVSVDNNHSDNCYYNNIFYYSPCADTDYWKPQYQCNNLNYSNIFIASSDVSQCEGLSLFKEGNLNGGPKYIPGSPNGHWEIFYPFVDASSSQQSPVSSYVRWLCNAL